MEEQKQSFGEQAVGLSFNPSGDDTVTKLKKLYAEIIDILQNEAEGIAATNSNDVLGPDIALEARRQAMSAQMWAVKAVTWKREEK